MESLHSLIHQIFIECLLCIRYQAKRCRAYENELVIVTPFSNAMGILPHQIDN